MKFSVFFVALLAVSSAQLDNLEDVSESSVGTEPKGIEVSLPEVVSDIPADETVAPAQKSVAETTVVSVDEVVPEVKAVPAKEVDSAAEVVSEVNVVSVEVVPEVKAVPAEEDVSVAEVASEVNAVSVEVVPEAKAVPVEAINAVSVEVVSEEKSVDKVVSNLKAVSVEEAVPEANVVPEQESNDALVQEVVQEAKTAPVEEIVPVKVEVVTVEEVVSKDVVPAEEEVSEDVGPVDEAVPVVEVVSVAQVDPVEKSVPLEVSVENVEPEEKAAPAEQVIAVAGVDPAEEVIIPAEDVVPEVKDGLVESAVSVGVPEQEVLRAVEVIAEVAPEVKAVPVNIVANTVVEEDESESKKEDVADVPEAPVLRSFNAPKIMYYSTLPIEPTSKPAQAVQVGAYVAKSSAPNPKVLEYVNEIYPEGHYQYKMVLDNGIYAEQEGTPTFVDEYQPLSNSVRGSFGWISPEGKEIGVTYTADQNGFQASGDAIPTPPPIPYLIERALQWIASVSASKDLKK